MRPRYRALADISRPYLQRNCGVRSDKPLTFAQRRSRLRHVGCNVRLSCLKGCARERVIYRLS